VPKTKNTGYMRMSDAMRRTGDAARATGSALRSGARSGASATRGTGRFVHRLTSASGAGRTGLATLIELSAASGAGDAFIVVALAGTIFFNTSVDQARGKVVLFLIVTMAPFAVLAPFIGPALDRVQQGRRYLLAGTLLARGLLCWGMSAAVGNAVTLLPAAFGILVLQKAYGVVRASVTPRLLPAEITLVTANARSQLIALTAAFIAGGVAEGIQVAAGAAWVLRGAMVVYLAAVLLALRLPDQVDTPPVAKPAARAAPAAQDRAQGYPRQPGERRRPARPGATRALEPAPARASANERTSANGKTPQSERGSANGSAPAGSGRWRTLSRVGPVVAEAMSANAVLRAFAGYMFFFLAFLLQTEHFGVSKHFALGAMVASVAAGSLVAMGIGSVFRSRAPQLIMFSMLTLAPVVAGLAAWFFGLGTALIVAFTSILCASLAKLSQDSIVQREIGDEIRSSTFSVSETVNQVANVAGGLVGVLVSTLNNGQVGLAIAAAGLTVALVVLVGRRRRRLLAAPRDTRQAGRLRNAR
jgi:Major Facilitator Superfamily